MSTALNALCRQAFPRDIRGMIIALLERYEIGLICLAMGRDKEHFEAKLFASLRQRTKLHPEWVTNNGFRYIGHYGYVELIKWLQKYPLGQKDIHCIMYGASAAGQVDVLECIESICGGADKKESKYCRVAARRGQLEAIQYLYSCGYSHGYMYPDVPSKPWHGVVLHSVYDAIRSGHHEVAKWLEEQKTISPQEPMTTNDLSQHGLPLVLCSVPTNTLGQPREEETSEDETDWDIDRWTDDEKE
jgi:hypothetical protein